MRQDWIEFEGNNHKKILLRPEYISSVIDESGTTGITRIGYDEHPILDGEPYLTTLYECKEPYNQVKQKIIDAEKVDLSDVVVEHFTKDEYETILEIVKAEKNNTPDHDTGEYAELRRIVDKLNKILKENK